MRWGRFFGNNEKTLSIVELQLLNWLSFSNINQCVVGIVNISAKGSILINILRSSFDHSLQRWKLNLVAYLIKDPTFLCLVLGVKLLRAESLLSMFDKICFLTIILLNKPILLYVTCCGSHLMLDVVWKIRNICPKSLFRTSHSTLYFYFYLYSVNVISLTLHQSDHIVSGIQN